MDYSFPRYLLSKQTVDDRALNKDVLHALRLHLPSSPVSVIEVGGGIGTMLKRMLQWKILSNGRYILVDAMQENIDFARQWIPQWAAQAGLRVESQGWNELHLWDDAREISICLECADVFDFVEKDPHSADLLIAHAFLDLLPMPETLEVRIADITIPFVSDYYKNEIALGIIGMYLMVILILTSYSKSKISHVYGDLFTILI